MAHKVGIVGSAQLDTAQSKFGGASLLVPGDGTSFAYLDGSSDFAFGSGDFTIEFWARRASATSCGLISWRGFNAPDGAFPNISYRDDWGALLYYSGDTLVLQPVTTFSANTWHHVAVARQGTIVSMFLDGVLLASAIDTYVYGVGTNRPSFVGGGYFDTGSGVDVWIDEFRCIKGFAAYNATFTPPSAPFEATTGSPAAQASTVAGVGYSGSTSPTILTAVDLLLHCDGADASTTFTDSAKGHTVTAFGSAQIDTGQSLRAGGAYYAPAFGSYLQIPDGADLAFGTGDYTVDFFLRFDETAENAILFVGSETTWSPSTYFTLYFSSRIVSDNVAVSTQTLEPNTTYHIEFTRASGTARVFVNGVQSTASAANSANYVIDTGGPVLGKINQTPAIWLDEFRITKGVAAHVANFDPPVGYVTTTLIAGASTVVGTGTVATQVNASGALAAQASVVAGAGTSRSTGTGVLADQAAVVAASGTSRSTGTGTPAAQASTVAGIATASWIGTGALADQASTVAGAGTSRSTGTGTPAAGVSSVAGTATASWVGTGSLADQASTVAGVGTSRSTGTGTLADQAATVVGTAAAQWTATGSLADQAATVTGTGTSRSTGTGALADQAAAAAGAGASSSSGTGTLVSGASTIVGTAGGLTTGTGTLAAGASSVAGAATIASTGTGTLAAGASSIAATATIVSTGTGALAAGASSAVGTGGGIVSGTGVLADQAAAVAGAGTSSSTGTATLAAGAATVAGTGAGAVSGTGTLIAGAAAASGAALAQWTASGALTSADSTVTGSGSLATTCVGDLAASAATSSGAGVSSSSGSGILLAGASSASGQDAPVILGSGALVAGSSTITAIAFVVVEGGAQPRPPGGTATPRGLGNVAIPRGAHGTAQPR